MSLFEVYGSDIRRAVSNFRAHNADLCAKLKLEYIDNLAGSRKSFLGFEYGKPMTKGEALLKALEEEQLFEDTYRFGGAFAAWNLPAYRWLRKLELANIAYKELLSATEAVVGSTASLSENEAVFVSRWRSVHNEE